MGKPVAHSILRIIYHMLRDGQHYLDLGADYYELQERNGKAKSYLKKLSKLGVQLTPDQLDLMAGITAL